MPSNAVTMTRPRSTAGASRSDMSRNVSAKVSLKSGALDFDGTHPTCRCTVPGELWKRPRLCFGSAQPLIIMVLQRKTGDLFGTGNAEKWRGTGRGLLRTLFAADSFL